MEVTVLSHPLAPVRRRIVLGLAAVALLAPTASANAAATPCAGESLSQVFAAWGDSSWYFLAPDGGFENGAAGWSLRGGAAVAAGNAPFGLGAAGDSHSLSLPAGASATSPPFCIRHDTRMVRWVQRGPRGALLAVSVVHVDPSATSPGRMLDLVRAGGDWEPSPQTTIPLAGTGARGTGWTTVALKFTALTGAWQVDDLYVDPKCRY
jgi:hypothetical protein